MKALLDLDALPQEGEITAAQYERLGRRAERELWQMTGRLVTGFGVTAVTAALFVMFPSLWTAIALGLASLCAGLVVIQCLVYIRHRSGAYYR
jgi:phosphatidylglycerophosphate synthase